MLQRTIQNSFIKLVDKAEYFSSVIFHVLKETSALQDLKETLVVQMMGLEIVPSSLFFLRDDDRFHNFLNSEGCLGAF